MSTFSLHEKLKHLRQRVHDSSTLLVPEKVTAPIMPSGSIGPSTKRELDLDGGETCYRVWRGRAWIALPVVSFQYRSGRLS